MIEMTEKISITSLTIILVFEKSNNLMHGRYRVQVNIFMHFMAYIIYYKKKLF